MNLTLTDVLLGVIIAILIVAMAADSLGLG